MPGSGPLPKEQHRRERNTRRREAEFQTVHPDDKLRGPELEGPHHPDTLAWYAEWRAVPHAQLFTATDWRRLRTLAPLMDKIAAGTASVAERAELRLNESLLGATYGDRLKLRVKIAAIASDKPDAEAAEARASVADRMIANRDRDAEIGAPTAPF